MMILNKKVPFYKNPDNTHCYQAVIKMILKLYWPKKDYSWGELDKITAKQKDMWTYPTAGMIYLSDMGVKVISIENFNYSRFSKIGGKYLIEVYGKEVGEECLKHTVVDEELKFVKQFTEKVHHEIRSPSMDEIRELLKNDYIIICAINSNKLVGKEGFIGHFVLVKGFDQNGLYINDPGPDSAEENRFVDYKLFELAWAYPDKNSRNIMAFKK